MSRQTEITLSFARPVADPAEVISEIMRIIEPETILHATRSLGESHQFNMLTAYKAGESEQFESEEYEDLDDLPPIDRAASLYRDGTCLGLTLSGCSFLESLITELEAAVDEDDLGEFGFNDVSLVVGDHDVLAVDASDDLQFYGRYWLSLELNANGTPTDTQALEREFPLLAEFSRLRSQLESRFGPGSIAFCYYL